jgi:endonuclease YncB( thermonuclease family)
VPPFASRLLSSLCLVLPLLLAGAPGSRAQTLAAGPWLQVMRVVDGDTVDVRLEDGTTERIRLIGIDTPEVVDPRKPVQCFGREASQYAHELLDGQTVSLELDASQGERDVYGRLLAYLWLTDGRNFGEVMIGGGFAHEYTYNRPYAYLESFRAAQDAATAGELGLWSPATCAGDTERPADAVAEAPIQPALLTPLQAPEAPQAPPAVTPPPAPPAPVTGFDPSKYLGQGNRYNCPAFASQADAQAVLRADPRDPNGLDGDRDGIACETNRGARDLVRVARP